MRSHKVRNFALVLQLEHNFFKTFHYTQVQVAQVSQITVLTQISIQCSAVYNFAQRVKNVVGDDICKAKSPFCPKFSKILFKKALKIYKRADPNKSGSFVKIK